jgi:hypothetical protein
VALFLGNITMSNQTASNLPRAAELPDQAKGLPHHTNLETARVMLEQTKSLLCVVRGAVGGALDSQLSERDVDGIQVVCDEIESRIDHALDLVG